MKLSIAMVAGVLLSIGAVVPGNASTMRASSRSRTMTFRLGVAGHPASNSTFWVAYGPLQGRFGVIRLQRVGSGEYAARTQLPRVARSYFSYIVGTGTVTTRAGIGPGDPVSTIKTEVVTRNETLLPSVHWRVPAG